ncbi:MAG TPA: TonB family protein [Planctomycetota bacterium]|nr:TonB family protein [Planctomycetota bacterium]
MNFAYRSRRTKHLASARTSATGPSASSAPLTPWAFSAAVHLAVLAAGWAAATGGLPEPTGADARFVAQMEIAAEATPRRADSEAPTPPVRDLVPVRSSDPLRSLEIEPEVPPTIDRPDLCLDPRESERPPTPLLPFSGPVGDGLRLPHQRSRTASPSRQVSTPQPPLVAAPPMVAPPSALPTDAAEPVVLPEPLPGNPDPVYPRGALVKGHFGTVHLVVLVDPDGRPTDIKVTVSSGYESLDRAARDAVAQWRFQPGTRNGARATLTRSVQVDFRK